MQKLHIKLKAAYPIVLLLACIIIISSFGISYALGLSKRSDVWTGQANGIAASSTDTYPYSRLLDEGENALDASKINKVGFDVLYGTTPDGFSSLVQFLGEVPYTETFDNGERASGWSGYDSYYEGTSLVDTEYWGNTGVEGGSAVDISQLEAVNSEDNIVSLRLYALSVTSGQIGFWIGNFFYSIQIFFAGLGTKLIGLLVIAKNIDMVYILDALGMDALADVVTKSFIGDHETGRISVFAGFCILMFIVSIAGMAIAYAKGGQKKMGWKDILVPVFVGVIITGACLAGRITDLGSTLANLTNEVVYAMAGAITDPDGTGGVFITDVDDEAYKNQVVQIQEMSLINKCFVDMQICTQLGVMDISELDIDNFGVTNTDILLDNGLYGVSNTSGIGVLNVGALAVTGSSVDSSINFSEDFGDNIGYYFWYANSGASYKTHFNQTIPETSPVASERKLTNFVTWMQDTYNSNANNAQVRELLRSMTVSLAAPSTGAGILRMFLFTGIMIVLFLCLWRYTKDILLAKFQMLVALLGMAIAGPLMFTGKKKLVNTGRDLMALILISFVEITVHSLMFDAIIYGTSIVISPNLFRLIITFFLLLLLWKFNKAINERIKKFTADLEKSMMSSGSMVRDVKQKANTALKKKPHELLAAKSAAYDAANPDQAGGLKSRLLRMAADSTAESGQQKGFAKITMDSMKDHKEALKSAAERRLDEAEKAVDEAFKEVETQESTMNQALQAKAEELNEDPTKWSAEARHADQERRKAEEAFRQVSAMKMDREMNSDQFKKDIANELAKNKQVCNAAAVEAKYKEIMKNYDDKLNDLKAQADKQKADFNTALTRQTIEDNDGLSAKQKANLSKYLDDGKTLEDAIKSTAQDACKDNIASAVKTLNKEANEQSNVKVDGARIGAPKVVNERAVATANATNLMMQEMEAGLTVDSLSDSKNLMESVTKATVMQNNFDKNNNSAYVATTGLAGDVREMTADMKAKVAEEVQDQKGIVRGIANGGANVIAGVANKSASVAGAVGTAGTSIAATATEAGRAVARVGAADISVQNAQNANSAVSAIIAARQTGTTDQAAIAAAAKQASDAYQKQKYEKKQKTASEATVINGAPAPGVAPGTPITKDQFVHDENRMTADKGKPQAQPQSPAASRPDIMNATRDDQKPKKKGFFSRNNPDDYE